MSYIGHLHRTEAFARAREDIALHKAECADPVVFTVQGWYKIA